jgi:hypothetical protein
MNTNIADYVYLVQDKNRSSHKHSAEHLVFIRGENFLNLQSGYKRFKKKCTQWNSFSIT